MIIHVFNSSVVSGPETLAIPALKKLPEEVEILFLLETRVEEGAREVVAYMEKAGYRVHVVTVRSRIDRRAIAEIRSLLLKLQPRILHAHDTKASFYVWRSCADRRKFPFPMKLVSTHHGAAFRKGLIRFYEEIYVRLTLNSFDHVLCMCQYDYESLTQRGVRPEKLRIHLNGVDRPKTPEAERTQAQEQARHAWIAQNPALAAHLSKVWLGAVARLSGEKRHDRMLRLMSELKKGGINAILVNFGRGPEETKLKEMTSRLDLEQEVFWMGYRDTIGQEFPGFDLVLCLSDGEGIPINLLEAAWAGTPVLSTRVGGIPDLIQDPQTGYLVDQDESDEKIGSQATVWLRDRAELRRRGQAFQKDVETRCSEKAWLDALWEVYSS